MSARPFLDTCQTDVLRRCAEVITGGAVKGGSKKLRSAIHDALADKSRLRALVEELSEQGRAALELMCELDGLVPAGHLRPVLEHRGGKQWARQGEEAVLRAGLLLTYDTDNGLGPQGDSWLGAIPPLADALRPMLDAWWMAKQDSDAGADDDHAGEPPRLGLSFAHVTLLACLAGSRLRVTTDGNLYQRDQKLLSERFASLRPEQINAIIVSLTDLRLLTVDATGRMRVENHRAADLLNAPPSEQAMRWFEPIAARFDEADRHVLSLLARRRGWHDAAWLRTLHMLRACQRNTAKTSYTWWTPQPAALGHTARGRLRQLVAEGLVEQSADGDRLRLAPIMWSVLAARHRSPNAPAEKETSAAKPCHLQPSFELIVPPEAHRCTLFELGRFCELVRFDAVATFRITEASVRAGIQDGLDTDEMIALLAGACAHGVPDNVAQGMRDFAETARPAYVFDGVVVVLPDEAARVGAKLAGLIETPCPGVFLAESNKAQAVVRKLDKAGFATTFSDPAHADDPMPGMAPDWELDADGAASPTAHGAALFNLLERCAAESKAAAAIAGPPPAPAEDAASAEDAAGQPASPTKAGRKSGGAGAANQDPGEDSILDGALRDLGPDPRAAFLLMRAGISTVAELVSKTEAELLRIPNIGRKTLDNIKELLDAFDLRLGMKVGPPAALGTRLAKHLNVERHDAALLCAALPYASDEWLDHYQPIPARRLESFRALADDLMAVESSLIADFELAASCMARAKQGFECCPDMPPLIGAAAPQAALRSNRDLWLLQGSDPEPIRVTPHRIGLRGRQSYLTGHTVADGEGRSFSLDTARVALGPKSAAADLEQAQPQRLTGARTRRKVGRNEPCPCGSGKKYKKCCLGSSEWVS